jgi:hypothetical protein
MRRIRVYADNSVFSGTEDEQFAGPSKLFFERVHAGKFLLLLSNETLREMLGAPAPVQELWQNLPATSVEKVDINDEVKVLAEEYVKAGVLGRASEADALHVAAATVAAADLILSWNFRHIVNYNRILGFNSVNLRSGYRSMLILSPLEVSDDD